MSLPYVLGMFAGNVFKTYVVISCVKTLQKHSQYITKYENYYINIKLTGARIESTMRLYFSRAILKYSQNAKIVCYPRTSQKHNAHNAKMLCFEIRRIFLHICVWNYFLPFIWKETLQNSAVKRKHEFIAPITWNLCFYIFKFYSHIRIFSKEALACQTDKVWN